MTLKNYFLAGTIVCGLGAFGSFGTAIYERNKVNNLPILGIESHLKKEFSEAKDELSDYKRLNLSNLSPEEKITLETCINLEEKTFQNAENTLKIIRQTPEYIKEKKEAEERRGTGIFAVITGLICCIATAKFVSLYDEHKDCI